MSICHRLVNVLSLCLLDRVCENNQIAGIAAGDAPNDTPDSQNRAADGSDVSKQKLFDNQRTSDHEQTYWEPVGGAVEIKPLVEQFLRERGLELSPDKTVITHIKDGFDFLGQNVRKYRNRKLLIKPSRKSIRVFLEGVRGIIRDSPSLTAAQLIARINPKIQGWANYHRHVVSKQVFGQVDDAIFRALWQWARRRHPMKTSDWTMRKYFDRRGNRS